MPLRIGILGITGKVGGLCAAACAGPDLALVGGAGRPGTAKPAPAGVARFPDAASLAAACDVVIDFSHAETTAASAAALVARGIAWVNGNSGLSASDEAAMHAAAERIPVVSANSFAPTAVLVPEVMTRLGGGLPAAEYDVEILETHHHHKVDAPSGTAIAIGKLIARARGQVFDEVAVLGRRGHVGPRKPGAIGFGAIRAGEIVGESSVLFLADDEEIVVTRRVFDRRVYATGAVLAARWAVRQAPGLYGMRDVLAGAAS